MTTTQPTAPETTSETATTPAAPGPARTRPRQRPRFSPRTRKAILLLHVVSSMTWLGLDIGLLALSITGFTSDDPVTLRTAYLSMNMIGDTVLIPASLLALVSGVALGVGTKWGLVRYRWVLVKLVLTVITAALTVFSLRDGLNQAAAGVMAEHPSAGESADGLLAAPVVSLSCYLFMTVLSIYKPWGRTRRPTRKTGRTP
ncbi:hypothetical protein [Actinomadura vinacea]